MLEIAALVVAIVNAIFGGYYVFDKLWKKIKKKFGNSREHPPPSLYSPQHAPMLRLNVCTERKLRDSPQHLIEAALTPLLRQDVELRKSAEAHYRQVGAIRSQSQWRVWDDDFDTEFA